LQKISKSIVVKALPAPSPFKRRCTSLFQETAIFYSNCIFLRPKDPAGSKVLAQFYSSTRNSV